MFPMLMPLLLGAGIGAIANKKDPLKGAVLGAGIGAAGGLLAPAAAGGGGLLGAAPAAAGASGAASGAAATGASSMASSLPAFNPVTGAYVNATSLPGMTGLTETLKSATTAAKPFGEAASTAMQAKGLLAPEQPMAAPAAPLQSQPLDLSGVLNSNQQEMARTFEEDMKRRQSMGDYARYAMGAR